MFFGIMTIELYELLLRPTAMSSESKRVKVEDVRLAVAVTGEVVAVDRVHLGAGGGRGWPGFRPGVSGR